MFNKVKIIDSSPKMDKLKGKLVSVVLTIQEAKGMESLKNLILIAANFNGRALESDPVVAEDNPIFNTNLVWEVEKRDLRKIRSSNQPLKVECLNIDHQNRKEKFGHVLLDLRSAQVIEDSHHIPYKWHKLIGVRNKKRNCTPELYVSLTIRSSLGDQFDLVTEDDDSITLSEPLGASSLPIKYMEDGYIKVGNQANCNEDFSLNIFVKFVSNLDLLLPEVLVFHQNKNKYCVAIKIFGIPIKTKQFTKDLHDTVTFDEKIVVRLLSNMDVLLEFFKEEKVEIGFYCGSDLLGVSIVGFEGLSGLNQKVILNSCYFKFPSVNGIVPESSDTRKPFISLEISLVKHPKLEIIKDIKDEFKCLVSGMKTTSSTDFVENLQKNDWIVNECNTDSVKNEEQDFDVSKACGDHAEQLNESKESSLDSSDEDDPKLEYTPKTTIQQNADEDIKRMKEELEKKRTELDDQIEKCKFLQQELQDKLEELKLSKTLRKRRKSCLNFNATLEENQKKFSDCDKELLIEYISKLQKDNDSLKEMVEEQRRELNTIQKSALTKEQTNNLLQELKGLEEKFEIAQQTKTYFKEQWQKACEEIHDLKSGELQLIHNQIKERRQELKQLKLDVIPPENEVMF